MHVLVTRSPTDAAALVDELTARGHDGLVEPMFEIATLRQHPAALSLALDGTQALLFTSANGVRAFAGQAANRTLPVFAVGDATAEAARAAGFAQVESAGGNVEDLAALVVERLDPARGALFHSAAGQVAGDLQGALSAAGFEVRRLVLYEAKPAAAFSPETVAALQAGAFDAVLFFSPRSASTFVRLLTEAGMQDACPRSHAVCLSPAVATEVKYLAWRGVHVAERPNTAALLVAFDRLGTHADRSSKADDDAAPEGVSPRAAKGPEATNTTKSAMEQDKDRTKDGDARADRAAEAPALRVIAAFGGIRPMAAKLGIAVSTVQGWRERAAIPAARHEQIAAAAKAQGVTLDAGLLAASDKAPAATKDAQAPGAQDEMGTQNGAKDEPAPAARASAARPAAASPLPTGPSPALSGPSGAVAATGATAAESAPSQASPESASPESKPAGSQAPETKLETKPETKPQTGPETKPDKRPEAQSDPKGDPKSESKIPEAKPAGPPSAATIAARQQAQAAPRRSGGLALFALGALVLAAGAAGAVVTRDTWMPLLGDDSAPSEVAAEVAAARTAALEAIEQRLAALESDLADLDGRLGMLDAAPDSGEAVRGLAGDLDDLAKRVGVLESTGQGGDLDGGGVPEAIEPLQQSLEDVSARLAGLEEVAARVASLEAASGGGEDAAAALARLSADAETLAGRLAETESRLGSLEDADSALRSEVEALDASERAGVEAATGGTALALAIGQLRVALRLSSPYAAELAQVRDLVQDDAEATALLAPLSANADQGVPTLEGLRRRFPEAARIAAAAGQGDNAEGFMGGVLRRISQVVSVRPVGMVEGGDAGSVVARAEARLEDGDLAGAVGELDGLTGLAAEAMASWRAQAEARLAADRAVSALAALAIGKLTAAGG